MSVQSAQPLRLEVRGLSTSFATDSGRVQSVTDVSFGIAPRQTMALVGESGSGKSVTSLSLMGLHAKTSQAQVGGQAWFTRRDGQRVNLLTLPPSQMRALRGHELAMVFQEPTTSLNPVVSIGEQIAEVARLHLKMDHRAALNHALRMLELVEIPAARQRLREYPHQLSGGMRQRVMIALAVACQPTLLIADEPTTALDVTIQSQILALMGRLLNETGMSMLFITHNLAVVAQYADAVAVMYAGRVVESAPVQTLFTRPQHPYTRGLLACLPGMARRNVEPHQGVVRRHRRLVAIPGQVASALDPPPGCAFAPRCSERIPACEERMPELAAGPDGAHVRCVQIDARQSIRVSA